MFTGLVEEVGQINSITKSGSGAQFSISAHSILQDIKKGDSIAVDGICLTVVDYTSNRFTVDAVGETLNKTTLSTIKIKDHVNLERAMKAESRFGGHFVQGHVDGIGKVSSLQKRYPGYWLDISAAPEIVDLCVKKGSITINGISLTIADLKEQQISIAVIPHTFSETSLKYLSKGSSVNIEADVLGKYVQKFLHPYNNKNNDISIEKLNSLGF